MQFLPMLEEKKQLSQSMLFQPEVVKVSSGENMKHKLIITRTRLRALNWRAIPQFGDEMLAGLE